MTVIEAQPAKEKEVKSFGPIYYSLDIWRGLAALSIVFYHCSLVISGRNLKGSFLGLIPFFTSYGYLGVPIFFVVSGYCIAAACRSAMLSRGHLAIKFIFARFRRIYPAYWAAVIFEIALALLAKKLMAAGKLHSSTLSHSPGISFGIKYWLCNISLTQPYFKINLYNAVSWTLCYELGFYTLMAVAITVCNGRGGFSALLALTNIVTICTISCILGKIHLPFPFDLWPEFGFGILAFSLITQREQWLTVPATILVLMLTISALIFRSGGIGLMGQSFRLSFSVAIAFAFLIVILRPYDGVMIGASVGKGLARLGLISYSLYLTHFFILGIVNQLVSHMAWHVWVLGQFTISILASIGFAILFWFVAERPFLRPKRVVI